MFNKGWVKYSVLVIFCLALIYLAYVPNQSNFNGIILPYLLGFVLYFFVVFRYADLYSLRLLLSVAVFIRIALIFSFPNLSDDIYRFIWDARCIQNGISPFQHLPSEIVGQYEGLDQSLFQSLNSPDYYSIYPPIGQYIGLIANYFGPESLIISSIIFKLFILASELCVIFFGAKLLSLLNLDTKRILIYALNPLIIIELTGNIHFEAFMIMFIYLTVWSLLKNKLSLSALFIGGGICSKLLPLMFIPLFSFYLGKWRKTFWFNMLWILSVLILFMPLINLGFLTNLSESLDLYIKKFEFNGGLYYAFRKIGYWIKGFNLIHIIGPLFSVFTVILICIQAFHFGVIKKEKNQIVLYLLMGFTTYLLFSPIVHPWYLATPIALCIFTNFRFPIVWSALITFTYINYSYTDYYENLWLVLIEYLIVFSYIFYELNLLKGRNLNLTH